MLQTHLRLAKENCGFKAGLRLIRPLFSSPVAQVLISFVLGYYATTKIARMYAQLRKRAGQSQILLAFPVSQEMSADNCYLHGDELTHQKEVLRLTLEQLKDYDGKRESAPVYTALNGNIYDLSSLRDTFENSGPLFSLLAGCNANQVLNLAYSSMGIPADDIVQRWENCLNAEFAVIGTLVDSDESTDESSFEDCD